MDRPNAAFYFYPDNYKTSGDGVVGRQSATGGFLRGFIRHSGAARFYIYADSTGVFEDFQRFVAEAGGRAEQATAFLPVTTAQLKSPGALFRPGPDVGDLAWRRRHFGQREFSITGITHTVSDTMAMQAIGNLLIAPVQPWDALVCTSHCVKGVVERLLGGWAGYLGQRFGTDVNLPCRLPVIPLGVDSTAMAAKRDDADARHVLRDAMEIGDDDVALLYAGRLNHVEKANPVPMYLAAERAARETGTRLHLIQAGQAINADAEAAFKRAATAFAPSLNHHFIDGGRDDLYDKVWAAADIFISLSDNIQESFGLSPIEAMAAGLAVVVSDYDGYRESVRDGIDGLTVPTVQPAPGAGAEMGFLYDTGFVQYSAFTATASQSTAVDIDAAAAALIRLINDPEARRAMGAAGRARAADVYDWRHVVTAHQELWVELAALRESAPEAVPPPDGAPPYPLAADPFRLFTDHATDLITGVATVRAVGDFDATAFQALYRSDIAAPLAAVLLDEDQTVELVRRIGDTKGTTCAALAIDRPPEQHTPLALTLGWLAKVGLIRVTPAPDDGASPFAGPFGRSDTWRKLGGG